MRVSASIVIPMPDMQVARGVGEHDEVVELWPGVVVASGAGYLGGGPGGLRELWLTMKARRLRRRFGVFEGGRERPSKKYMN